MIDAFTQMKIPAAKLPAMPASWQASAGMVFAVTSVVPIVTHLVVGTVIWFVIKLFVKPPEFSTTRLT